MPAARPVLAPPLPPEPSLHLDQQLCFALYAASLAMTKVYRPLLAALGLTYPQYLVLLALWQHGELTAGALGQHVALDSGTLSPLVRKLVAQGWLQRQRSASDDRSVLVSLTAAGAALRDQAHAVHAQVGCATQYSAEQLRSMTDGLRSLRQALMAGPLVAPPAAPAAALPAPS